MRQYYAPDFEVKITGLTMAADVKHAVISLSYENNLDQADMFTLVLDNANLRFTDSALFDVGKEVEIHLGYSGNLKPMMLGEIVDISPTFPEGGAPTLTIRGFDKSHRMRHNHKQRPFFFSNASIIAAQIAAENLLIPVVHPTTAFMETKYQNGSDMALLKELARRTFFETYVHWDRLYFRLPRLQTEAVYLEWGKNLSSFSPRLSSSGQVGMVALRDYDQQLAQVVVGLVPVVAADTNLDQIIERLGSQFVDKLKDFGVKYISAESVSSYPDAIGFAKALLEEILEGLFEGSGSCIGIPELRAGEMVDIRGVGKRFSGKYRLRQVTHTLDSGGYRTRFEVTQRSGATMLQLFRKALGEAPNPEKQPSVNHPVIGKVVNTLDPLGLGRVQLNIPELGETHLSNWAKVITPAPGIQFIPHPGDDVYVSFEKDDINRPVVIGTSWNVREHPPAPGPAVNLKQVIKSRLGHTITLDDTPGTGGVILESVAGAKIILDSLGGIVLQSRGGAKLKLDGTTNRIDLNPLA